MPLTTLLQEITSPIRPFTYPPLEKGGLGGFTFADHENPPKSPFLKGDLKESRLFNKIFPKPLIFLESPFLNVPSDHSVFTLPAQANSEGNLQKGIYE